VETKWADYEQKLAKLNVTDTKQQEQLVLSHNFSMPLYSNSYMTKQAVTSVENFYVIFRICYNPDVSFYAPVAWYLGH
jgi:hypothetical protein